MPTQGYSLILYSRTDSCTKSELFPVIKNCFFNCRLSSLNAVNEDTCSYPRPTVWLQVPHSSYSTQNIGETVVDLDARRYNSAWKSVARTPIETVSLYSEESANLKCQIEVFIDIFDANDFAWTRAHIYVHCPTTFPFS